MTLVLVVTPVLVVFGAPGSRAAAAASGPVAGAVAIGDDAYRPAVVTVAVGTTVTWTNSGAMAHSVTADDALSFDSSLACAPLTSLLCLQHAQTFSFTFARAGAYGYHDRMNRAMHGTVIVVAPGAASTVPASTPVPPPTSGSAPAIPATTAVPPAGSATAPGPDAVPSPAGAVVTTALPGPPEPGVPGGPPEPALDPGRAGATLGPGDGSASSPSPGGGAAAALPGRRAGSPVVVVVAGVGLLVLGAGGLALRSAAGHR